MTASIVARASAGSTNEASAFVICKSEESNKRKTEIDETEDINCFWLHPDEFFSYIQILDPKNEDCI